MSTESQIVSGQKFLPRAFFGGSSRTSDYGDLPDRLSLMVVHRMLNVSCSRAPGVHT